MRSILRGHRPLVLTTLLSSVACAAPAPAPEPLLQAPDDQWRAAGQMVPNRDERADALLRAWLYAESPSPALVEATAAALAEARESDAAYALARGWDPNGAARGLDAGATWFWNEDQPVATALRHALTQRERSERPTFRADVPGEPSTLVGVDTFTEGLATGDLDGDGLDEWIGREFGWARRAIWVRAPDRRLLGRFSAAARAATVDRAGTLWVLGARSLTPIRAEVDGLRAGTPVDLVYHHGDRLTAADLDGNGIDELYVSQWQDDATIVVDPNGGQALLALVDTIARVQADLDPADELLVTDWRDDAWVIGAGPVVTPPAADLGPADRGYPPPVDLPYRWKRAWSRAEFVGGAAARAAQLDLALADGTPDLIRMSLARAGLLAHTLPSRVRRFAALRVRPDGPVDELPFDLWEQVDEGATLEVALELGAVACVDLHVDHLETDERILVEVELDGAEWVRLAHPRGPYLHVSGAPQVHSACWGPYGGIGFTVDEDGRLGANPLRRPAPTDLAIHIRAPDDAGSPAASLRGKLTVRGGRFSSAPRLRADADARRAAAIAAGWRPHFQVPTDDLGPIPRLALQ